MSGILSVKLMTEYSAEVLEAMAFQIGKEIGAKAAVLHGEIDQIIFYRRRQLQ